MLDQYAFRFYLYAYEWKSDKKKLSFSLLCIFIFFQLCFLEHLNTCPMDMVILHMLVIRMMNVFFSLSLYFNIYATFFLRILLLLFSLTECALRCAASSIYQMYSVNE